MMRKKDEPDLIVATCLESTSSVEFRRGQFADDAEEPARGERGGAALDDFASTEARMPVSRSVVEMIELAINGLHQGIAKDGKRGAGADDVLDNLETGEERFPRDDAFHSQTVLRRFEEKNNGLFSVLYCE
jgi:hypothetical protein